MMNNLSINTEDPPAAQKSTAGLAPQTRAPAVMNLLSFSESMTSLQAASSYCLNFYFVGREPDVQLFTLRKKKLPSRHHHKFSSQVMTPSDPTKLAHKTGKLEK